VGPSRYKKMVDDGKGPFRSLKSLLKGDER